MYVMDADGTDQVELIDESNSGVDSTQPAWSPAGTQFAYTRGGSEMEDIFVSNASGTSRFNVTFGPRTQLEADWRPRPVPSGYPRPKGATPTSVSLVPAHEQCAGGRNRSHGPPLVYDSCAPPLAASETLAVGTPDANGMPAQFTGRVLYAVVPGNSATTADEADVRVELSASDVRLASNLADYTGELQARVATRITDRGSGLDPATVQDLTIAFTAGCTATANPNAGADCGVTTTLDAVTPGIVAELDRAIWELGRVEVYDGGEDGLTSTQPNTVFLTQGIFVP